MELSDNYRKFNVDLAQQIGIESALYFQQIYDVLTSTDYVVAFDTVANIDKITENTSLSEEQQKTALQKLLDNNLLFLDGDNATLKDIDEIVEETDNGEVVVQTVVKRGRKPSKNYEEIMPVDLLTTEYVDYGKSVKAIAEEYDIPTYVITKLIKQYDIVKPKKTQDKGDAKTGVKVRLLGKLNSTSEEYIIAVGSWIDSVQDKFGLMRNDTFSYAIESLDKFADHNLDVALEVLKIATANQYRDMNWAINNYKSIHKTYNKPTVLNNVSNVGLHDVGSNMTLDERKKYLEENQSTKVF